jgi:hypothetical protein
MRSNQAFKLFSCLALLSLTGCAAAPMRPAQYRSAPAAEEAIVTFVRESIFMGDGIHLYLWDGDAFVGTLSAGTLVQYRTKPGQHVFMASSENWSYVKADLKPGKHYYIKANMFPGFATMRSALQPVESGDDRVTAWPTKLKVKEVVPEQKDKYVATALPKARAALQEFNDGAVKSFDMGDAHAR